MKQERNTYTYKTNINCSGCEAAVKPHLDRLVGADNWKVNIAHPDKLLEVKAAVSSEEVMKTVQQAGYKTTPVE